jgi:hypothetical protein
MDADGLNHYELFYRMIQEDADEASAGTADSAKSSGGTELSD